MASSCPFSSSPARHSLMLCGLLVQPAPFLLSFHPNKITSQPPSPVNLFPPLSLPRSRLIYSRSGDLIDGSWLWWAMGTGSRRLARDSVHTTSVLLAFRDGAPIHGVFVLGRYKLFMEMKEIRLQLAASVRHGARRWPRTVVETSPLRRVLLNISVHSPLGWSQMLNMRHACLDPDSNAPCASELKVVAVGSPARKLASCRLDCADARGYLCCSLLFIAWSGESGVEDPGLCIGTQILLVNWKTG